MDFVRDVPVVSLCDELSTTGGYSTYFADVFYSRPSIDDIKSNVEWSGAPYSADGEAFDTGQERGGLH